MNTNDRDFLSKVVEDYHELVIMLDLDDRLKDCERARTILERSYFREGIVTEPDPRQLELNFHSDWREALSDGEQDEADSE